MATHYESHRNQGSRHEPRPSRDLGRLALAGRQELFKKNFEFKSPLSLPDPTLLFTAPSFADPQLQQYKSELNAVKSKLDDKDLNTWKSLTKFTNQTGSVVFTVRDRFRAEMCTNAFAKMLEMLSAHKILPLTEQVRQVSTVHICEAPGAFIAATNHYLRQLRGESLDWAWTGLSLNPYYEGNDLAAMIDDDAFILNTNRNWYFGRDNSGNIMSQENIRGLWQRIRENGRPVQLVTGDGSIDCSTNPNEQELVVSSLHFAEAVCTLGMLSIGGCVVLKLFTLFEHETVSLLYLMGSLFDRMEVNKPATSTQGNSEVYLLLFGYHGCPEPLLEKLLSFVGPELPAKSLIPLETMGEDFLSDIRQCARQFAKWQQVVLERNLALEKTKTRDDEYAIKRCRSDVADEFIRLCKLKVIDVSHRIVTQTYLSGAYTQLNTGEAVAKQYGKRERQAGDLQTRQAEKEARDDYLAGFKHSSDDSSSVVSKRSKTQDEGGTAYGSVAPNLLQTMGLQAGQGLGLNNTGMLAPISVQVRAPLEGLGSNLPDIPDLDGTQLHSSLPQVNGEPFFEETDGSSALFKQYLENLSCHQEGVLSVQSLHERGWGATVAVPLPAVILSKFCREKVIKQIYGIRDNVYPALTGDNAAQVSAIEKQLFCTADMLSQTLGVSVEAARIAHLDSLYGLACGQVESLCCLDLSRRSSNSRSPLAEYLVKFVTPSPSGYSLLPVGQQLSSWTFNSSISLPQSLAEVDILSSSIQEHVAKKTVAFAFVDGFDFTSQELIGNRKVEAKGRIGLFADILLALRFLKGTGSLVIKMGGFWTRTTVGIVHLLSRVFEYVKIVKPWSCCVWTPDCFLVCRGFVSDCDGFRSILEECVTANTVSPNLEVLSLAPMQDILQSHFLKYMCLTNERLAQRTVAASIKLEWALCHPTAWEAPPDQAQQISTAIGSVRQGIEIFLKTPKPVEAMKPTPKPLVFSRFVRSSDQQSDPTLTNSTPNSVEKASKTHSVPDDAHSTTESSTRDTLPPNWTKIWSKTQSRFYYFNKETGSTRWERP